MLLIGAEDVGRAGREMAVAAAEISRAAGSIEESMATQRRFMDDWLTRLEAVLQDHTKGST
jgi:hypothetical protein